MGSKGDSEMSQDLAFPALTLSTKVLGGLAIIPHLADEGSEAGTRFSPCLRGQQAWVMPGNSLGK